MSRISKRVLKGSSPLALWWNCWDIKWIRFKDLVGWLKGFPVLVERSPPMKKNRNWVVNANWQRYLLQWWFTQPGNILWTTRGGGAGLGGEKFQIGKARNVWKAQKSQIERFASPLNQRDEMLEPKVGTQKLIVTIRCYKREDDDMTRWVIFNVRSITERHAWIFTGSENNGSRLNSRLCFCLPSIPRVCKQRLCPQILCSQRFVVFPLLKWMQVFFYFFYNKSGFLGVLFFV